MNKKKAKEWVGKNFRVRPMALRFDSKGQRLTPEDDPWRVEQKEGDTVKIKNTRTDHVLDLGLDHVREWRSPDFLLLRAQIKLKGQVAILEPIVFTSADRNVTGFETLLENAWRKEIIAGRQIWISEVDNLFQIEAGERKGPCADRWTRDFPDVNSSMYPVYLKVGGVSIKELTFVTCDGGRIFMPLPYIQGQDETLEFFYKRSSLEYKVGQVIGEYYIYRNFGNTAKRCGFKIEN